MIDIVNELKLTEVQQAGAEVRSRSTPEKGGLSFSDTLLQALGQAHQSEDAASQMAERFASGDPGVGLHETVIAAEKASISVRYVVSLKNKLLEAYRELMNTPL